MTPNNPFITQEVSNPLPQAKRSYTLILCLVVVATCALSWGVVKANEAVNDWQLQREKQAHLDAITEAEKSADLFRAQIKIAEEGIAVAKASWTYHNSEIQRINGELGK